MNIEQANAIPLPEILQKIGCTPVKEKGNEIWYNSPFRMEKTASFHINTAKNKWYDFGVAKGGDVVNFVRAYLECQNEDNTVQDAFRWIKNIFGTQPVTFAVPHEGSVVSTPALTVSAVGPLKHLSLISYLESRGISPAVAQKYLKEIVVSNAKSGKQFHAIGWPTESEGYELRNKYFKGCIGAKSITFIRGKQVPAVEIHIFEGIMDFLTAVESQKDAQFMGDVIIMNSVYCLPQVSPYIKNYVYRSIYTWLDNDNSGELATNALKQLAEQESILTFQTMNKSYAPYKDVNQWHIERLKADKNPALLPSTNLKGQ